MPGNEHCILLFVCPVLCRWGKGGVLFAEAEEATQPNLPDVYNGKGWKGLNGGHGRMSAGNIRPVTEPKRNSGLFRQAAPLNPPRSSPQVLTGLSDR
jgi:hypothetical protein